jgi:methylenetetrahydrofolate reductase (NADPH)
VERMASAPKEQAKQTGIDLCVDIIKQVREIEGVAGVHIMAIEWEEAVHEICEKAGLLPRP